MRIEFDPTNRDEATAVRAVLTAIHGAEPVTITKREDGPLVLTDEEITEVIGLEPDETYSGEPVTDANGEPWDARIHSTPPKTNTDGTWRAKRGVTAEVVAAVRAEREALTVDQQLSEAIAETAERLQESTPTEPEFAEALAKNRSGLYMTDVPAQEQSAPPAPNAPVGEQSAPPAPPAPIVQPEPVVGVAPSFLDVMKAITAAQKDGKIDTAKVKELCAAVGAGDSTMGLNGADKAEVRAAFMVLLTETVG